MNFSVALPVYNGELFLQETIEALLDQERPPDEIIVVDDGSTDRTSKILSSYLPRIKYTRIDNVGPGAARKIAVEQCRNDWIALCDADDIWNRDHLRRKSEALKKFPNANVLGSNFISFSEAFSETPARMDGTPPGWLEKYTGNRIDTFLEIASPYRALLDYNPIYPSGVAFSKEIYNIAGGIDPIYSRWQAEDAEFIRRLVSVNDSRLVIDTTVTWKYRRHASNISSIHWKNIIAKAKILQAHIDKNVTPATDRDKTIQTITATMGQAFDTAYWDGFFEDAVILHAQLPVEERTVKRYTKKIISTVRSRIKER